MDPERRSEIRGNFKEISGKFRRNFINSIEHNSKPVHVDPKRRSEIRGNFKEISRILTSSDTFGLG